VGHAPRAATTRAAHADLPRGPGTAAHVARARQHDALFATSGHNSLLSQGTVVAIEWHGNDLLVVLDASVPPPGAGDRGNRSSAARVGETISVRSEDPGRDASRNAGMVLLRNGRIAPDGSSSAGRTRASRAGPRPPGPKQPGDPHQKLGRAREC
jgi:hypothetical protein